MERNIISAREDFTQRLDTLEDVLSSQLTDLSNQIGNLTGRRTTGFDLTTRATLRGPGPSALGLNAAAIAPDPLGSTASICSPPVRLTTPTQPFPESTHSHPTTQVATSRIPDGDRAKAQLGDETFVFNKRNVPDPPAINFSKDLDRLFREWERSTLLCIDGRNIPIKYWPEFYKKSKGVKANAWNTLRTKWDNWKVRDLPTST